MMELSRNGHYLGYFDGVCILARIDGSVVKRLPLEGNEVGLKFSAFKDDAQLLTEAISCESDASPYQPVKRQETYCLTYSVFEQWGRTYGRVPV